MDKRWKILAPYSEDDGVTIQYNHNNERVTINTNGNLKIGTGAPVNVVGTYKEGGKMVLGSDGTSD